MKPKVWIVDNRDFKKKPVLIKVDADKIVNGPCGQQWFPRRGSNKWFYVNPAGTAKEAAHLANKWIYDRLESLKKQFEIEVKSLEDRMVRYPGEPKRYIKVVLWTESVAGVDNE